MIARKSIGESGREPSFLGHRQLGLFDLPKPNGQNLDDVSGAQQRRVGLVWRTLHTVSLCQSEVEYGERPVRSESRRALRATSTRESHGLAHGRLQPAKRSLYQHPASPAVRGEKLR